MKTVIANKAPENILRIVQSVPLDVIDVVMMAAAIHACMHDS